MCQALAGARLSRPRGGEGERSHECLPPPRGRDNLAPTTGHRFARLHVDAKIVRAHHAAANMPLQTRKSSGILVVRYPMT